MSEPLSKNDVFIQRASLVSLTVSLFLLIIKYWGYRLTGSQAVLSDAMETVVNIAAALVALIVVMIASKPADRDHPYGHGKVEYFSAAFEGGLITLASFLICVQAIQALIVGVSIARLDWGIGIMLGAGGLNCVLGFYLLRVGKSCHSETLVASGRHVLSDFWTSAGAAVGLLTVSMTGLTWIDPLIALVVGLLLGKTGLDLVRRSVGGLLDAEDRGLLEKLRQLLTRVHSPGVIQLHHCRVIRSGRFHHIDAHAVVPEFWDVAEAHSRTNEFAERLMELYPYVGELHLHIDPCRRAYCRFCDVENCPIRRHPFEARRRMTLEELTNPEEPIMTCKPLRSI